MAIIGYQREFDELSAKIDRIKAQLGLRGRGRPKGSTKAAKAAAQNGRKKRTLSAAGRDRIAAAQRARWAARKEQAQS